MKKKNEFFFPPLSLEISTHPVHKDLKSNVGQLNLLALNHIKSLCPHN